MATQDRNQELRRLGEQQAEALATATRDPEAASAVLRTIIEAHDAARSDGDDRALKIQPITPTERQLSEGLLAVADELLVWDRDADDAVAALAGDGPVAKDDLVTTRVRRLRLENPTTRDEGAAVLARAVGLLDTAGLRCSFNHAVVHNDLALLFNPLRPFMTAKGSEPPQPVNIMLPELRSPSEGSRPVKVAVIDTGAEAQRDDQDQARRDGYLRTVTGDDDPATHAFDPPEPLTPGAGHGSGVAGVIQMLAPAAELTSSAALYIGLGSEVAVAQAILQAARDGAEVINLSLGASATPQHAPLAIEDALSELPEHVLVVAAAGNSRSFAEHYPAAFKRVIAVGATDDDFRPATYSNRGPWVDVSTRGTGIAVPFTQGTFDPGGGRPLVTFSGTDPVAAVTGTSFAAPQVAGALAQLLSEGHGPAEAVAMLKSAGRPEPDFGVVVPLLQQ